MKPKGRVVLCGQIAMYNTDQAYPPPLGDDADLHADMNEIERWDLLRFDSRGKERKGYNVSFLLYNLLSKIALEGFIIYACRIT